jgi:hypothetical protein
MSVFLNRYNRALQFEAKITIGGIESQNSHLGRVENVEQLQRPRQVDGSARGGVENIAGVSAARSCTVRSHISSTLAISAGGKPRGMYNLSPHKPHIRQALPQKRNIFSTS